MNAPPSRRSVGVAAVGETQVDKDEFARDVTDEVLNRIADFLAIPDAARVVFCMNVRGKVGSAREIARRMKLKLAADKARNARIRRAAEHLLAELDDVDDDTRVQIEQCLRHALSVMAWENGEAGCRRHPKSAPTGRNKAREAGATNVGLETRIGKDGKEYPIKPNQPAPQSSAPAARPQRLDDVIDTLGWVITATEPGRRGAKPTKEAFQFLVRFLVRDARVAGGKRVLKNLMDAIGELHRFLPAIVPVAKKLPKRTIERAMAPIKRRPPKTP
jgi:hypothetical protein